MTNLKTLGPDDLATLLGRAASTIKTDVRRRPETLPPRLQVPGSKRLLWLEQDVIEWIESIRKKPA